MEEVLQLYASREDPRYPLVCFDESPKQLISETQIPHPVQPGQPPRCDYQYERNGTANLFMFFAPLIGWRHVEVTDQRTQLYRAQKMKYLVDHSFPNAVKIRVVQDNLNIHVSAALYKAFPAPEAGGFSTN